VKTKSNYLLVSSNKAAKAVFMSF